MLASHPFAALEYWFFKVNAGPLALIVDWIARRRTGELWLRASVHAPGKRVVLFERSAEPVSAAPSGISAQRTAGQVGDIRWDLAIDCGDDWIAPDIFPARLLRMTDLALVSAPLAAFSGGIWLGDERTELQHAPGLVSHYWGRQLAAEWWWVSANQFDRPSVAVECSVFRSALWGIPIGLPLAYLYLRWPDGRALRMSPPARARVTGTPERFTITVRPLGGQPIRLQAAGREYGDFGEGIANTLIGDLDIYLGDQLLARAAGTAGLERRALQLYLETHRHSGITELLDQVYADDHGAFDPALAAAQARVMPKEDW
jgi:hypothetical protein